MSNLVCYVINEANFLPCLVQSLPIDAVARCVVTRPDELSLALIFSCLLLLLPDVCLLTEAHLTSLQTVASCALHRSTNIAVANQL